MHIRARFVALLAAAGLAACAGDSGDAPPALTPMPGDLPGVYSGDFPCSNCAAIAATAWLRDDGRFVLRQIYRDADGATLGPNAYALGRWRWDESTAQVVLEARGPERRLARRDSQRLELVTASPVAHVLVREPAAPPFTDRVRLDGESAIADGNATFKECSTQWLLPVAKDGGYDELRRQHRRMNRSGRVTLTAVEAHLAPPSADGATAETLILDRVIELKPGVGC